MTSDSTLGTADQNAINDLYHQGEAARSSGHVTQGLVVLVLVLLVVNLIITAYVAYYVHDVVSHL